MKTEAYKLYSREFLIFLPNVIKIDPYNFELHRFKVGAFFLRHSVYAPEPAGPAATALSYPEAVLRGGQGAPPSL